MYGKADYIAFETDKEWLLVKRRKLIDLINSKVTDTAVKILKNYILTIKDMVKRI